jgi:C4-dicarboxylate transporter DctQ subunit
MCISSLSPLSCLPSLRRLLSRLVAAACVVVCLILTWKGIDLVRPIWSATIMTCAPTSTPLAADHRLPDLFGLMAVEFSRFVVRA